MEKIMTFLEELMKKQAAKPVKGIRVKVENIGTGEVERNFYCGLDQQKADKLEQSLLQRTNLDKFHVYQSIQK